jgi:hypothetical protein
VPITYWGFSIDNLLFITFLNGVFSEIFDNYFDGSPPVYRVAKSFNNFDKKVQLKVEFAIRCSNLLEKGDSEFSVC